MRRRELQTIQLKLSELKEYEQAKIDRAKAREQASPRTPTPTSDSDILVLPSTSVPAVILANNEEKTEAKTKASAS
ncbi:uncharacterized protein LOC108594396 [Drosophila busckii]|uniref:uncharacterized protein LOC108594396 n=1 Tax=Drosophila busckii TaxID=30019 RepID=UPI001433018D|nr:uncharacterized protein LOC108594396 [Drosophila busckii]